MAILSGIGGITGWLFHRFRVTKLSRMLEDEKVIRELERIKEIVENWKKMEPLDEYGDLNLPTEGSRLELTDLIKKYEIPSWLDLPERAEHIDLLIALIRKHGYEKSKKILCEETTYREPGKNYIDELFEYNRRQSEIQKYIEQTPYHEQSFGDFLKKRDE